MPGTDILVYAIKSGAQLCLLVLEDMRGHANDFYLRGSPDRNNWRVLSGMAAGLVGMAEVAKLGSYNPNFVSGLGFAGIGVALLGRNHPGGIAIGAIVFAFLDISSGVLQITGSASREIVYIMQGIILLAAVISYEIVQRYRLREEAKQAGDALSESVTS